MADEFSLTGAERSIDPTGSRTFGGGSTNPEQKVSRIFGAIKRGMQDLLKQIDTGAGRLEKAADNLKDAAEEASNISPGGGGDGITIGKTKMAATKLRSFFGGGGMGGGGGAAAGGAGGLPARMLGKTPILGTTVGLANMGINAVNNRFASGREGVLEADRMSVLYQQMTGLSQLDVSSRYRMPLTQYRLGAGGINALMGMEAQIGISGTKQAASIEALRTMSGYAMSAGEATQMIGTLSSAPVANRMMMMTGMGLIGPGGKQNTTMSVMQNLVRVAGLTSKEVIDSALLPGSITRAKLTSMGVPPEMQTQVIQYAKENLTFQEKGGRGMYDPSKKVDRRLMGIEENFATQVEETQRLETKRDESFYRRQVDNYANLERQTQSLTRAFAGLENTLSGILGAVGQNRIATTLFQGATSFMGGDPPGATSATSSNLNVTVPTHGGKIPLNQLKENSNFKKVHPKFQDRLLRMMKDNPNVGFGEGYRDASKQASMFMSRYRKTNKEFNANGEKNVKWNNSYWEHVSGAPAAPPGRSMHEIGLAVDLIGDLDWVVQNAHKYGLKHFGGVNGEPWHVQPAELPNSRAKYEEAGASWGRGPGGAAPFDKSSNFGEGLDHSGTPRSEGSSATAGQSQSRAFGSGSISDRVSRRMINQIQISDRSAKSSKYGKVKTSAGTPVAWGSLSGFSHGGQSKSGVDIARWSSDFLRSIGAPVTLANMEAMSAWIAAEGTRAMFNPLAVVTKPTAEAMGSTSNLDGWTDFNSVGVKNFANYEQGLKMNAYHVMQYGKGVVNSLKSGTSNPYDVVTSIERMVRKWAPNYAARDVLESRGVGTNLGGDPAGSMSRGGGGGVGGMSVIGGHTFNISPTINLNGSGNGSPADLQKIARELAIMVRREIELEALRSV